MASKQNLRDGLRSKNKEFEVLTGSPLAPALSPPPASVGLAGQTRAVHGDLKGSAADHRGPCYHSALSGGLEGVQASSQRTNTTSGGHIVLPDQC